MTKFSSFAALGAAFAGLAEALHEERKRAMEKACVILEEEAKAAIGTYRDGYNWPQLAEATQEDRVRKGFTPNDPLLRTGELQRSIEHKVESADLGYVGTNDAKAKFQEFGTSKIPPRPFLGGALHAKGEEVAEVFGHSIKTAIESK